MKKTLEKIAEAFQLLAIIVVVAVAYITLVFAYYLGGLWFIGRN